MKSLCYVYTFRFAYTVLYLYGSDGQQAIELYTVVMYCLNAVSMLNQMTGGRSIMQKPKRTLLGRGKPS